MPSAAAYTTTATIRRSTRAAGSDDHDAAGTVTDVATGVRANFDAPSGRETDSTQERVDRVLYAATTDLRHTDIVVDDTTGETWHVEWVQRMTGRGMDHIQAGLTRTAGAPPQ